MLVVEKETALLEHIEWGHKKVSLDLASDLSSSFWSFMVNLYHSMLETFCGTMPMDSRKWWTCDDLLSALEPTNGGTKLFFSHLSGTIEKPGDL